MLRITFLFTVFLLFPVTILAAPPRWFREYSARPTGTPTRVLRPTRTPIPTVEARRSEVKSNKCGRRTAMISRTLNKFQDRLIRFAHFFARVQSRRDKLAQSGKDISKIDLYLLTAKSKQIAAQTILDSERETLTNLTCDDDVNAMKNSVLTSRQKVRQAFTEFHTAMKDTVQALREKTAQ